MYVIIKVKYYDILSQAFREEEFEGPHPFAMEAVMEFIRGMDYTGNHLLEISIFQKY